MSIGCALQGIGLWRFLGVPPFADISAVWPETYLLGKCQHEAAVIVGRGRTLNQIAF
jgi:hypothetical protein